MKSFRSSHQLPNPLPLLIASLMGTLDAVVVEVDTGEEEEEEMVEGVIILLEELSI